MRSILRPTLVAALVVLIAIPAAWSCNLPLDPKVVVIPEGQAFEKTEWGVGVGSSKAGPMVSVVVDEGTTVTFRAYVNISGTGVDFAERTVTIGDRTMELCSLPTLEAASVAKLKFGEMVNRNMGGQFSNPNAISLGGTIKDMTINGTAGGGFFGSGISATGMSDMRPLLPNPGHGSFRDHMLGPDAKVSVVAGQYKTSGQFRFELLSSTFEFDVTGIERSEVKDGGRAGVSSYEFNVPTSDSTGNGPEDLYYAGVGKVDLTLAFDGVVWTWQEQRYQKNASGAWELDGSPTSHETHLNGNIVRTSEGSDTGGHPGYFYVKVRDKSPSIYSRMVGNLQGPAGTTGDPLPGGFNVTFDMVDNNPLKPTRTSIPVDCFYTLAVTDYKDGGYSVGGMDMDKLKFAEYKDKIIWKKVSAQASLESCLTKPGDRDSASLPGATITGIGKAPHGPLTNNISRWRVSFSIPEKMGLHYALESNDTSTKGQGQLLDWQRGRLKYFVLPKADGQGNDGPTYDGPGPNTEDAGAKEGLDPDYSETRAAFAGVTTGNPAEEFSATEPNEDISKVVGTLGWWEVRDNDPPNLFLAIKDTRSGVTHIFGNNTQTVDSGTAPFTGYANTTDNAHCRTDSATVFEFTAGDSADQSGYDAFRAKYAGQSYVFHNHGDNNDGLWIDEDSKLVFSTWGYDNINTYSANRGLADGSAGGSSGPHCWWGQGMDFSSFSVTDNPGNNSGKWFPDYIFRDPNRPTSLNSGDCSVTVSCSDGRGGSRTVKVNVYVIWNKKEIRSLEEIKYRKK
jgi:hypothetical protein